VIGTKESGLGKSDYLSSQINAFYAKQLNYLISDKIHFVDINFDVQSYRDVDEYGHRISRTNLYYSVGRSFFKDRVEIAYKGTLRSYIDEKTQESVTNFAMGELTAELKLTKDGRYRAVFFRKDSYEGLLEGEVISTGGGLKLIREYYTFRDIFRRR
jgi:hypothetical protein